MTTRWKTSDGFTTQQLLQKSAELALGIEPVDVAARVMNTPLFTGRLLAHEVQPGLIATASDITYCGHPPGTIMMEPGLICSILLAGQVGKMRIGRFGSVTKSLERPVLVGFGQPVECASEMDGEYYSRDAGFVLKPGFFQRFGPQIADDGLSDLQEFLQADFRTLTLPGSPQLLDIARRCLDHPYNGQLGELFLESNTLNFVLEVASLLSKQRREIATLGKRHYDRVAAAREILDHHLVSPPSTLELARLAGMNITTLQNNFKQVFGTTIFGYVRDRRLMMARILLQEHDLPAAEIGRRVGFSSPAAFTTAYKRHFGYPPSAENGHRVK